MLQARIAQCPRSASDSTLPVASASRAGCAWDGAAGVALLSHGPTLVHPLRFAMATAFAIRAELFIDYRGASMPRGRFRSVNPP